MEHDAHDELVTFLANTPDLIADLAREVSTEGLGRRAIEGEFSFVEQACHLRDLEVEGYAVRIRRLLDEDCPRLDGFDGTRVAAERDYASQDFGDALARFREARLENARAVADLDDARLARRGVFDGTTEVTLGGVLAMMRQHDEDHLEQLRTIARLVRDE